MFVRQGRCWHCDLRALRKMERRNPVGRPQSAGLQSSSAVQLKGGFAAKRHSAFRPINGNAGPTQSSTILWS